MRRTCGSGLLTWSRWWRWCSVRGAGAQGKVDVTGKWQLIGRQRGRHRHAHGHLQAGRREAVRPLLVADLRRGRLHRHRQGHGHHLLVHRGCAGHGARRHLHGHGRGRERHEGQGRARRARRRDLDRQAAVSGEPVSVADVMRDLEDERSPQTGGRGSWLVAGLPNTRTKRSYAHVERVLRRARRVAGSRRAPAARAGGDDHDWRLQTHLTFSSHRGALGGLIVWTKRRILLPLTRWLYEYSLENFKRQERVNRDALRLPGGTRDREREARPGNCRIAGLQNCRKWKRSE